MLEKYLHIHPEIQKSIFANDPVVALDSSMIFDNLHYPENIELLNNICKEIRHKGVIPATIAIINGILKIGLTETELEFLSLNKDLSSCNKNNLPFAISEKLTCTTCLDTCIILAHMAGLKLIVTGKNINSDYFNKNVYNMDLYEFSCKNITIICNDNISLDFLNNTYVPVIKYIEHKDDNLFPKNLISHQASTSSIEIAKYLKIKYDLNLDGCMIIANSQNNNFDTKSIYNNVLLASKITKHLSTLYKLK